MPDLTTPTTDLPNPPEGSPPKRFSNREAEETWSGPVTTHTGMEFLITPARPDDRDALQRFFDRVAPQDLYFRFLSGLRKVDEERLQQMVRDDDDRSIDFLAIDQESGEIIASAMLGADENFDTAEFAVCTREDMKHRGISWALLDHAARYAEAMGIGKIVSLESASQADALQLEREMGFTIRSCPDDATLKLAEKTF
ncbi:GNAT family N-acetyltransferase [Erythrobacter sp. AP23]|uniref:GNAT family N-acetyltransferase n=1 Tax=Erythrobacter sp. AP23 TaxID=499656 RepID=UPI0009F90AA6|nr:GNAT family N-acetyltransferase [Erythrobacter sp. AP23]